MVHRRRIGGLYWSLGTPIALLLDARAVWANLQTSPTLWLWAASFALAVPGIALTMGPWGGERGSRLGWFLVAAALVLLTPQFLLGYFGVAGWYHLAAGLLVFRLGGEPGLPYASVVLLFAANLFLLALPAMTRPGPAPVVSSVGYPLFVAPLGSLALVWAAYAAFGRD